MRRPSVLRNIVYSKFGYWPVDRIDHCDLQTVPVYCISLVRAERKRRLISQQVKKLGLERFEFVDAVDAMVLSREDLLRDGRLDDEATIKYHSRRLSVTEIACSLSHGAVYSTIVARGDPVALIIEDDALFLSQRIREFRFSDVPAGFDVVFLNAFRFEEPPKGHVQGIVYDVISYSGSAAAYLVSQEGARKLSQGSLPVVHAADGLLGRCMELAPGQNHPFKQRGATTTIKSFMVFPDCVLNGSDSHYYVSDIR